MRRTLNVDSSGLIRLCVKGSATKPRDETRQSFDLLVELLRHIDECPADVLFFADEGRLMASARRLARDPAPLLPLPNRNVFRRRIRSRGGPLPFGNSHQGNARILRAGNFGGKAPRNQKGEPRRDLYLFWNPSPPPLKGEDPPFSIENTLFSSVLETRKGAHS